jgi:hypothetical protein
MTVEETPVCPPEVKPEKPIKERKRSLAAQAILSERAKKFDAKATEEDCLNDLRRVQMENEDKFITRNFYRVHGEYSDRTWNRYFGTFLEFRRQAGLEISRNQHAVERHVAKHKSHDIYRELYEEVKQYADLFVKPDNGNRFKTLLVCADLHDVSLDPFCWGVFLDVAKRVKPDVVAINGDVFDEVEFSKYSYDPRRIDLEKAFKFVREQVYAPLRATVGDDTQIDFIIGNHDWRILRYFKDKNPNALTLLSNITGLTLADLFGLPKYKINLVSRLDLNEFTPALTREQIRNNFKTYWDCVTLDHVGDDKYGTSGCNGHWHKVSMHSSANVIRGAIHWVEMGCMCRIDFDYQEKMNKSHQSFVLWHVDTEKKTATPDHVIFSDEWVCALGKYYFRKDYDPEWVEWCKKQGKPEEFFKTITEGIRS